MNPLRGAYVTAEIGRLLGISDTAARKRAAREGWTSRPREGRGGGQEWLYASMPEATRLAIGAAIAADRGRKLGAPRRKQSVNGLTALPPAKRDRAEARALVVQMAQRFAREAKISRYSAQGLFCLRYNEGEITVPGWVREKVDHVCLKSLYTWERVISTSGPAALAGKYYGNRKGSGAMAQPYILGFCLGHIYKFPHIGPSGIHADLKARLLLQKRREHMPSLRVLQLWYKEWRDQNSELFTFIFNPDEWRSRCRAAFGDAAALVDRLNQEWEMDSSPCDLLLSDGKRHTIVACLDIWSRRVKFHVSRTSSSHAVAACLRKAIIAWGIPETVRTDNGKDYASRHIDRILLELGILHDLCTPFSPEQKPYVERVFRSLSHQIEEALTGYTGHNVLERKALEARKSFAERMMQKDAVVELPVSPEELQKICDRWADDTYMHSNHSALGETPYERLLSWDGPVSRVEDEAALRPLFFLGVGSDGTCVVGKKGIRALSDTYIAPELGLYQGRRVQARVDDEDYGIVHVYSLDSEEFICAARGIKHSGMSAEEVRRVALTAKRLQKAALVAGKKVLAGAAKEATLDEIAYERMKADELLARQIEAEQPLRAEVVEIHSTPALEAAAEAARKPVYAPPPVTEEEQRAHKEVLAALERDKKTRARVEPEETPARRYRRASRLEEALLNGGEVSPDDARWLRNYQSTGEYDAQKRLWACCEPELLKVACG